MGGILRQPTGTNDTITRLAGCLGRRFDPAVPYRFQILMPSPELTATVRDALVRVAAALGLDDDRLESALAAAHGVAPDAAVDEVILQSHLFVGYPRALNAMVLWRRRCPVPGGSVDVPPADRTRRGEDVCRVVYGRAYEELRANVRALHPALDEWMLSDGYGRVLARPGLDVMTRELCIVALLVTLDVPRQLYSHLRGSLHAGATEADVERAVRIALDELDQARGSEPEARRARVVATWTRVRERAGSISPSA